MTRPDLARRGRAALAAAALAGLSAGAGPGPVTALDFAAHPRLFDTHFGRYGPRPTRVLVRDAAGLRLRLPAEPGGARQVGLYSYFALAGDFEVSAGYEVLDLPPTTTGYGAGFGVAVGTEGPDGDVTVRRGHWPAEGRGVQVARGKPVDGAMTYETAFFPTSAKRGKVVVRRVKDEVVVLAADTPTGEPVELTRLPFTAATVRNVRVVVDPGGSPTTVDGRLTGLRVTAEEITGGIPERDRDRTPAWVYAAAFGLAAVLGVGGWGLVARRRKSGPTQPAVRSPTRRPGRGPLP